jgi:hypothetical protein
MAILIQGSSGIFCEVDSTWKALRVTTRPLDHGSGGYYRISQQTGALTGLSGATPVHAFRNNSATLNVVVWWYKWTWVVTTAYGAAQLQDHALYIARSWSSNYGGGSAATLTGNNQKKRTAHATCTAIQNGDCRISTTAALTGTPTITLDSQPIIYRQGWAGAIGASLGDWSGVDFEMEQEHPLVLAQNEGLVLQSVTAMGATGVIKLGVEIAWTELPLANF